MYTHTYTKEKKTKQNSFSLLSRRRRTCTRRCTDEPHSFDDGYSTVLSLKARVCCYGYQIIGSIMWLESWIFIWLCAVCQGMIVNRNGVWFPGCDNQTRSHFSHEATLNSEGHLEEIACFPLKANRAM